MFVSRNLIILLLKLRDIRDSLASGDNKALHYLYTEFGAYCINILTTKKGCAYEDAEDLFIESVMIFREKVLDGTIQELTNVRYYLYKTCENKYLARLKSERSQKTKVSDVEQFFYTSSFVNAEDEWDEGLSKSAKRAWEELGEKCKDILYYFYVDSLRMAEISELMGFSTTDVTKTTKARCYKKLITSARSYYSAFSG